MGSPCPSKPFLPARTLLAAAALAALSASPCAAFCGYYVSSAEASLYNQASKVVIVRDGDRTVLTMVNDYQGDPASFAIVVPVPVVLQREQIRVIEPAVIDRLDAFSAPRLVEYYDPDPCQPPWDPWRDDTDADGGPVPASGSGGSGTVLGVTVEATYVVGEYEIVILSATQSDGLEQWLEENGYRQPEGASAALQPYIRQGLKFFVARVNLTSHVAGETQMLRPIQMDFTSPRFMLPIRLGMLNATEPQDLVVFALSRNGRVELANYRTERVVTDVDVPPGLEPQFGRFYRDMFRTQHERAGGDLAHVEYFWNMAWCDPCSADPLTTEELNQAGVWWREPGQSPWSSDVFLTRLHVRYDPDRWPEDLVLRETADHETFQAKYVMHQPFEGPALCQEAAMYRRELLDRRLREANTLAELTGWSLEECRAIAGALRVLTPAADQRQAPRARDPWWRRLFR
jgi:hypothetical protein